MKIGKHISGYGRMYISCMANIVLTAPAFVVDWSRKIRVNFSDITQTYFIGTKINHIVPWEMNALMNQIISCPPKNEQSNTVSFVLGIPGKIYGPPIDCWHCRFWSVDNVISEPSFTSIILKCRAQMSANFM